MIFKKLLIKSKKNCYLFCNWCKFYNDLDKLKGKLIVLKKQLIMLNFLMQKEKCKVKHKQVYNIKHQIVNLEKKLEKCQFRNDNQ